MLNHIKRINEIGEKGKFIAGCTSESEEITVADVVKILNYIKGDIIDILVR